MIVWIDPDTFDVLNYAICWKPDSLQQWHDVSVWCEKCIGPRRKKWYDDNKDMQISSMWYFKTKEDYMLFKLTWE